MTTQPRYAIYDMPGYFGLKIEYRDDLPADNAGYLDPAYEPQYIAINRNLPRCEQAFTIGHELCHFLKHNNVTRRNFNVRLLNHQWESRRAKTYARYVRQITHKLLPIEFEADMYAVSMLFELGAVNDLKAYLDLHPEKTWLFLYVVTHRLIRLPFRLIKLAFTKLLPSQTSLL